MSSSEDGEATWSGEEEEYDLSEKEIDLYGVLGLTGPSGDELLKDSEEDMQNQIIARLRTAYHRRSIKWHPSHFKSRYR